MFRNLNQLTDTGPTPRMVRIYQVWDAARVVVAKVTASEARASYAGPQYQFTLLHEVFQ